MIPRPPMSPLFPYTTLFRSTVATVTLCCKTSLIRGVSSYLLWRKFLLNLVDKGSVNSLFAEHLPKSVELPRSEEHTSELQSLAYVVCRLLLEKNKAEIPRAT